MIIVLVAENAAHVKAVAAMTERDLDPLIGRSIMADGAATTLAGAFGGSGTTTYAENIGVMGLTRVYSTLAYIIAGGIAIALALLPKFGAVIAAIPVGVLGGAVTVLFGLIAVLGARIWIEATRRLPRPGQPRHRRRRARSSAPATTRSTGATTSSPASRSARSPRSLIYQILRPLSAGTPCPPTARASAPATR